MTPPWIIQVKRLVINERTAEWCRLPYPGHKRGCPKYGKDPLCPPKVGPLWCHFDLSGPLCLVHSEFDLPKDIGRRKLLNPKATEAQLKCVLYWQDSSRKILRNRVRLAQYHYLHDQQLNEVSYCPEAMGLNVYATARLSGLHLEKIHDLKICRHVALLGRRKS